MQGKRIRLLLTKSEMDTHDRAITYVATMCRDAGIEVILTLYGVVDEIVSTAVQEDVDAIGVSFHSGRPLYCAGRIMELLRGKKRDSILVMFGGAISPDDEAESLRMGIAKVWPPGSSGEDIISYLKKNVEASWGEKGA